MPIPTRQRGFVAWLAIVALWLTIVAPVVSQTLGGPMGSLIGASACGRHHADGGPMPPDGHPLDKCGYCGLLAGHSMLPDAAPALVPPMVLGDSWLPGTRLPERSRTVLLAAAPRGPPVLEHV